MLEENKLGTNCVISPEINEPVAYLELFASQRKRVRED
jgi:hypothetical protein